MTGTCDLISNRVLMCMQMTAEPPFIPVVKEIDSFEEALQTFKPHFELIVQSNGNEERELIYITSHQELSLYHLCTKSEIIQRLLSLLNISFHSLFELIQVDRDNAEDLKPLSNYFHISENIPIILTNLHKIYSSAELLIGNYIRLAQFFHFSPRYHWENPRITISILNASTEVLSDQDNLIFIDEIRHEITSAFDKYDNSRAYSILLIPGTLQGKNPADMEQLYNIYFSMASRYNLIFLSEIGPEDSFYKQVQHGDYKFVPWYFMSSRFFATDKTLAGFKLEIGFSHLLCSYILVHHRFTRNFLHCNNKLPFDFYVTSWYDREEKFIDSHFYEYWPGEGRFYFLLYPSCYTPGNHFFEPVETNFIKVFANKILVLVNIISMTIDRSAPDFIGYQSIFRSEIEREIQNLLRFWAKVRFEWNNPYHIPSPIHEIEFMLHSPASLDVFMPMPVQLYMLISFRKVWDDNQIDVLEDTVKARIHISNFNREKNDIEYCNNVHVEFN